MRADRLLSLLMLLQIRGRLPAHELAKRLEVSERTIYRDIEALSAAGVPVYTESGPGGGCVLAEGYRTNLTGLTEAEVRTLFMSSASGLLADLELGQALEAALLKLLAALPSAHRQDAERSRQRIYLDVAGWHPPEEAGPYLRTLQEAVWNDRRLLLTYRKANGEIIERLVDPLGLVAKAGIWYLVGAMKGEMRVLRISRVQAATITEEPCQRPEGFDLATYWAEWSSQFRASWPQYPVTVRVAPEFVPILPQVLGEGIHTLLQQADPPDASGWITLTLTFETFEGARTSMLGFGTNVEVLEPQELREGVAEFAARIVAFYAEKQRSDDAAGMEANHRVQALVRHPSAFI